MIIKGYKSKPIYSLKQKRSTVDINDVKEYKFLLTNYSIITILNHSVLFPSKNNLGILQNILKGNRNEVQVYLKMG